MYMRFELSNGQWLELKGSVTWGERRRIIASNPYALHDKPNLDEQMAWSLGIIKGLIINKSEGFVTEGMEDSLTIEEGEKLEDYAMKVYGLRGKDEKKTS